MTLKKGGKVVKTMRRVLSADGTVLTVHRQGTDAKGAACDDPLVYNRQ